MTQPTSRTTFKDYCKRKLGHPVVELNLDDDQIEDAIDDAVQYFQEYHYDGTHPEFVKKQISASTQKLAGSPTGTFTSGETIEGGSSGIRATFHEFHSCIFIIFLKTLHFSNSQFSYYLFLHSLNLELSGVDFL